MVRQRVRIRFSKTGDLRWISHRDLMRAMERLFRRASLPLSMSEGFHPKPRMSFPSALAVGIAGLDEVMELELSDELPAETVYAKLLACAPAGLEFRSVEVLSPGVKKAQIGAVVFEVPVPAERQPAARAAIERFQSSASVAIDRQGRAEPVELKSHVERLELDEGVLRMRLKVAREGAARPREVLAALGLAELESEGYSLVRTKVEVN